MAQTANTVDLKPQTLEAFDSYIVTAEADVEESLGSKLEVTEKVRAGEIIANYRSGKEPVKVPSGLIHDWVAAAFIPNATVRQTLDLIQDYDNHKNIYRPDVMDSRLVSHHNNNFKIYLRLLKKKIITVVLDTDHDVHYKALSRTRWCCKSYTTRIAEVENAGTANEKVLAADTGYGFLWRLYSYWRFEEDGGGVIVECRAISLTRDVPTGLGWMMAPIIRNLPRESLINTLRATREGVLGRAREGS